MGEVSVLLTRNAGSEQHLTATVTFAQIEHDIPADSTASLLIDDRILARWTLSTTATFASTAIRPPPCYRR